MSGTPPLLHVPSLRDTLQPVGPIRFLPAYRRASAQRHGPPLVLSAATEKTLPSKSSCGALVDTNSASQEHRRHSASTLRASSNEACKDARFMATLSSGTLGFSCPRSATARFPPPFEFQMVSEDGDADGVLGSDAPIPRASRSTVACPWDHPFRGTPSVNLTRALPVTMRAWSRYRSLSVKPP